MFAQTAGLPAWAQVTLTISALVLAYIAWMRQRDSNVFLLIGRLQGEVEKHATELEKCRDERVRLASDLVKMEQKYEESKVDRDRLTKQNTAQQAEMDAMATQITALTAAEVQLKRKIEALEPIIPRVQT